MAEGQKDPAVDGILLDIGDGVGALVIYTRASLAGSQIEVSRSDRLAARIHTDVHERRVNGKAVFAAVFAALPEGLYRVWTDDSTRPDRVTIQSGEVAELDWR
jgi:hypothetical protein